MLQHLHDHISRIGKPEYHATKVSWNDNSRYKNSSFGANITDAKLVPHDSSLGNFTVIRPKNFDDKIGKVSSDDICVIVNDSKSLRPVTLKQYLKNFNSISSEFGKVSLMPLPDDFSSSLDDEVSIRFQTVFIPVDGVNTEFTPETYNYQTKDNSDPKNIILLCTSQGTFVQQDKVGSQKQYLQKVGDNGVLQNTVLDARPSKHGITTSQVDTIEEATAAVSSGLATTTVLGHKSMGIGFNRLMTIQIPLKQTTREYDTFCYGCNNIPVYRSAAPASRGITEGVSAARVSAGSVVGNTNLISIKDMARHESEHITITVQYYITYNSRNLPSAQDVLNAINLCESSYDNLVMDNNIVANIHEQSFASTPKPSCRPVLMTMPAQCCVLFPRA
jgi:hypothetical protein